MKKLILTLAFCLFASWAFAETWELAVCKQDAEDLKSGHKRKKQYDIIAAKPKGHPWSDLERKHYLIVVIDGLTQAEADALTKPLYKDGIEPSFDMEKEPVQAEVIGKRRFKLNKIAFESTVSAESATAVDWSAAMDEKEDYQPLKDGDVVVDFKTEKGVYDKVEAKAINYGTAELSAAREK